MPTKVVNKGATEFKIEVIPLLISVCAKAKKNGGKNELQSPAIPIHFQSVLESVFNDLNPIIKSKVDAKTILNPPTCNGVYPTRDLLIKINEEPHINERVMR
jgi:hypothetical protein|tara:strand:+ start:2097 stop:2402 length:306 start_codon:yes stop_codon:yes gene_type:complete